MQILQGMPILGFFDESLATMQRKFILYRENILGCQRNNPRGNVLPSLRSGGLFYPRCARVKQLPPFSSIGKNNFPPLVFLRLPKFFHNTRTSILCGQLFSLQKPHSSESHGVEVKQFGNKRILLYRVWLKSQFYDSNGCSIKWVHDTPTKFGMISYQSVE